MVEYNKQTIEDTFPDSHVNVSVLRVFLAHGLTHTRLGLLLVHHGKSAIFINKKMQATRIQRLLAFLHLRDRHDPLCITTFYFI